MSKLFSLYHEIYYYRCSDERRDSVQRYDVAVGGECAYKVACKRHDGSRNDGTGH